MLLEQIPAGAIQCLKCKSIDGVVCHYRNQNTVAFSFSGLDSEKRVIYTVVRTSGSWEKGKRPDKTTCAKCAAGIPYWMLDFNPYVKSSHTS